MAFSQLRHRPPSFTPHQTPNAEWRIRQDAKMIADSTKAIARSLELLDRTERLPGMEETPRKG